MWPMAAIFPKTRTAAFLRRSRSKQSAKAPYSFATLLGDNKLVFHSNNNVIIMKVCMHTYHRHLQILRGSYSGPQRRRFPRQQRYALDLDVDVVEAVVEDVAGPLGDHEGEHEGEGIWDVAGGLHQDDCQADGHSDYPSWTKKNTLVNSSWSCHLYQKWSFLHFTVKIFFLCQFSFV